MRDWKICVYQTSMRTLCILGVFGFLLVGVPLFGQAQEPPKKEEPTRPVERPTTNPLNLDDDIIDQSQVIKTGFILRITVAGEAEPSDTYFVDTTGSVVLKYQGTPISVTVSKFPPKIAADEIAKAFKKYLNNPVVSVSIVGVPRSTVFLNAPALVLRNRGPATIKADTTLQQILTLAEYSDLADLVNVKITRTDKEGKKTTFTVDLKSYMDSANPDEKDNPVLQNKDQIWVPSLGKNANSTQPSFVYVGGEVVKTLEKVPYHDKPPMTVIEAITQVGGTGPFADRKRIQVRRAGSKVPILVDLDLVDSGDETNNVELKANDSIIVPRLAQTHFYYVNGGLAKTGRFPYDHNMTLTQAIMENGGPVPYAKLKDGVIIRHLNPDGDPNKTLNIPFNFEAMLKRKKPDIALLPGDAIYIPAGSPPTNQPWDVFRFLNFANSVVNLYNQFTGRGFGFGSGGN
ncbi:MAG: SLBB domain-containing protein [Armatimonadetes bacterium]|nr:SLBB domain-containing protein [Armatimonadota bacterium]